MAKKIYSQPMTKVLSLHVSGDVCNPPAVPTSPIEPDEAMYGPPAPKTLF